MKATAWAAGFPVRNALYQNSQNALTDYIGPEMDKGFRISQYASPYRFVIAADLAYGLLSHRSFLNQRWHYHGRFPLNGVREISGYPIISLELQPDPISDAEETLLGEAVTGKKIRTFLQQFVKEAQSTIELAIIDDPSDHPDPKYEEQFNKAMVAYRDRASQDAGESETPNLSIPDPMLSPR
ncbi:MAG TPA: hypothetical protein VLM37_00835 [Fibrobacteraceae bacterium]|nr:hypothetical protein [Fibrobacteraceae bacterium]